MAPRYTAFNIILHYTEKKTNQQILNEVHRFYLYQIENRLTESFLEDSEKLAVIGRLLNACNPLIKQGQ